jgi:hypothetical protein
MRRSEIVNILGGKTYFGLLKEFQAAPPTTTMTVIKTNKDAPVNDF